MDILSYKFPNPQKSSTLIHPPPFNFLQLARFFPKIYCTKFVILRQLGKEIWRGRDN